MSRTITISKMTLDLVRSQARWGLPYREQAMLRPDGLFDLPLDDDVAQHLDQHRLPSETDEVALVRLIRAALGARPN